MSEIEKIEQVLKNVDIKLEYCFKTKMFKITDMTNKKILFYEQGKSKHDWKTTQMMHDICDF